ncbi:hypothetical protein [Prevotella jejuni]|uniref:hypothetical protein n=1 Tax=Prevotella jejuni TaxID=1177574 RepID=UPI003C7598DB
MKVLIKAVVKEAVKSDVGSKAHWIKKIGRVCLGCKCHMVMGGKGMVLAEKRSVDNEGNSKHLRKTPTCNGLTKLLKVY